MRSEIRVFKRNGVFSRSKIQDMLLPFDSFKIYRDIKEKRINDDIE